MMTKAKSPAAWGIEMSKFWMMAGQTFPIDVALLAIEVTKTRFAEPISKVIPHGVSGIDGMLSKRSKHADWVISFDDDVKLKGRVNFTLGHEFGHYLLHRTIQENFSCGSSRLLDFGSYDSKQIESEANEFSSFLLMPADDFKMQIGASKFSLELLGHCANRYETSFTATALRWLRLTDEAAMIVVADNDDFVCWSYCSDAAKKMRSYISPGSLLPQSSVDYLKSGVDFHNKCRRVGAGVWHRTEEAEEWTIVSDQYEQAIFLIRFPLASSVSHDEEVLNDSCDYLNAKFARKQ